MTRKQREREAPSLFSLKCEECGKYLVRVPSGAYVTCPDGHGRLHVEQPFAMPETSANACTMFDTTEGGD